MNTLQFGLISMSEMIPDEHTPSSEDTFNMLVEVVERLVTPEDGGDSDAGKQVVQQYMQQILSFLDTVSPDNNNQEGE